MQPPPEAEPAMPPPAPSGLDVAAGVNTAYVSWDNPFGTSYPNHGLARVYRSTVNDFATAVEIGTTDWIQYTDNTVMADETYYYWVRFESDDGVLGPVSPAASGMTAVDPEEFYEGLVQDIWNDPFTYELLIPIGEGSPSYSNPISGSATWTGDVTARDPNELAVTGDARLQVDFSSVTVDIDFTNLTRGHADMSWHDLGLSRGVFNSGSIRGTFIGSDHGSVRGWFDRNNLNGGFKASR